MDWQLSTLVRPVSIVFQALYRTPHAERDAAAIARNTVEANRAMGVLAAHLAAQPFVAGDTFTMGDIPVGATAHRWLEVVGIERPELAAVRAWRVPAARHAAAQLRALTRFRTCGTFID
jgi:glutathione S-transferase